MENMELENKPQELNYDIANTLYVLADSLGKNYEEKGLSPFDEDYKISDKFIRKVLENREPKHKIVAPLFMENSNKDIKQYFLNSLEENKAILADLSQMLSQGDFDKNPEQKEEIKEILDILKARQALLEIDIEKLDNDKENAFDLFCELIGLGKRIEEIMEDTYTKKLQKEIIIQNLVEYARGLARIAALKNAQINEQKNIAENKLEKQQKIENTIEITQNITENTQNNEKNEEFTH